MPDRKAEAMWNGDLKSGNGNLKLGSGMFEGAYSFVSRFEDGEGTNPEELIGGCTCRLLLNGIIKRTCKGRS